MSDQITAMKSRLEALADENDRIVASFKVGEEETGRKDGVVVTPEQRDAFRKNMDEVREIKSMLDDLDIVAAVKAMKDGGIDVEGKGAEGSFAASAAMIAAAQAQGLSVLTGPAAKSLGEMFTSSDLVQDFIKGGGLTMQRDWQIEGKDLGSAWIGQEQKDVYTGLITGATNPLGFGTVQRDPMVLRQFRTSRVRDLFPVQQTTANMIEFFRVTGLTNNAAPVAERSGGAFALKPQSTLSFEPTTAAVRTIAHFEVAHRNVLQDEPQLQGIINNELLYGLRLQEDYQILQGTGTGEDLLGILNTPGIQTHDADSDPANDNKADSIRRAATKAILAYYEPTGIVVHPYDWEDIELAKDANDRYLVTGAVAVGAEQRLWRMPVVDTPAMVQGRFLVGAFGLGATLYDRMIANIRIAEQHADFFIRNAVLILAEQRLALATKRPESFVRGDFKDFD